MANLDPGRRPTLQIMACRLVFLIFAAVDDTLSEHLNPDIVLVVVVHIPLYCQGDVGWYASPKEGSEEDEAGDEEGESVHAALEEGEGGVRASDYRQR